MTSPEYNNPGPSSVGEVAQEVSNAISELQAALDGAMAAIPKVADAQTGLAGLLEGTQNVHARAGQEAIGVVQTELESYVGAVATALELAQNWVNTATGGA